MDESAMAWGSAGGGGRGPAGVVSIYDCGFFFGACGGAEGRAGGRASKPGILTPLDTNNQPTREC